MKNRRDSEFQKVGPCDSIKGGYYNGLPRETRTRILERDVYQCRYCGASLPPTRDATVDHVIPVSRGGCDSDDNLVAACRACNSRKHDRVPAEWGVMVKPSGFGVGQELLPFVDFWDKVA